MLDYEGRQEQGQKKMGRSYKTLVPFSSPKQNAKKNSQGQALTITCHHSNTQMLHRKTSRRKGSVHKLLV